MCGIINSFNKQVEDGTRCKGKYLTVPGKNPTMMRFNISIIVCNNAIMDILQEIGCDLEAWTDASLEICGVCGENG